MSRTPYRWLRVCVSSVVVVLVVAYGFAEALQLGGAEAKPAAKPDKPASSAPAAPPHFIELPSGKVVISQSDVEMRIRAELTKPTEMQYLDTTIGDVANDLSLRHKIPIVLDKPALVAAGKGPDDTVNGSFREGTLRSGLKLVLAQQDLAYVVRNDALIITTKTEADAWTSVRVYQVHDLVRSNGGDDTLEDAMTLLELVRSSIQPEDWRENGGVVGEGRTFVGPGIVSLVITQSEEGHEQIEALLNTLRQAVEPKVLEAQQQTESLPPRGGRGGGMF